MRKPARWATSGGGLVGWELTNSAVGLLRVYERTKCLALPELIGLPEYQLKGEGPLHIQHYVCYRKLTGGRYRGASLRVVNLCGVRVLTLTLWRLAGVGGKALRRCQARGPPAREPAETLISTTSQARLVVASAHSKYVH